VSSHSYHLNLIKDESDTYNLKYVLQRSCKLSTIVEVISVLKRYNDYEQIVQFDFFPLVYFDFSDVSKWPDFLPKFLCN